MIAMRWACLTLFVVGLAGCGGQYDPATDPAAAPARQAQEDRIEKLKQKSAEAAAKTSNGKPGAKR